MQKKKNNGNIKLHFCDAIKKLASKYQMAKRKKREKGLKKTNINKSNGEKEERKTIRKKERIKD